MEVSMSGIDEMLRANAGYVRTFDLGDLPTPPRLKLAIVTCMDSRILPSRAFGVKEGDAHIIRNAGGRARDALRSLIISQRLLGTNEIAVIHHNECGSLMFSNPDIHRKVREALGADATEVDFQPFRDLPESGREDVGLLLSAPLRSPEKAFRRQAWAVQRSRLKEVQV